MMDAKIKVGKIKTWASGHKMLLGAGAVGAVVLLALRARSSSADTTSADAGTTTDAGISPQAGTVGGYDSSANDIYNALQPQIDQTQSLLRKTLARIRAQNKRENKVIRQLKKAERRAARKGKHHKHHGGGNQTPPTKPIRHPHNATTRRLSPRLGTVTIAGGTQRRLPAAAPRAVPRAVVTRRKTNADQLGRAAGLSFAQVNTANRGTVQPGRPIAKGTRITLPPTGGRR